MSFDVIGDVHGQYDKLVSLFQHLGYSAADGVGDSRPGASGEVLAGSSQARESRAASGVFGRSRRNAAAEGNHGLVQDIAAVAGSSGLAHRARVLASGIDEFARPAAGSKPNLERRGDFIGESQGTSGVRGDRSGVQGPGGGIAARHFISG